MIVNKTSANRTAQFQLHLTVSVVTGCCVCSSGYKELNFFRTIHSELSVNQSSAALKVLRIGWSTGAISTKIQLDMLPWRYVGRKSDVVVKAEVSGSLSCFNK